ncbi:tetratricopeptide repeat protein [Hydrogenophaga aquatica]
MPLPLTLGANTPPHSFWRAHIVRLACAAALLCAAGVQAQEAPYQEVNRLLQAGELALARKMAEDYLGTKPNDPQMRFLHGVIQTQQGQDDAALDTFMAITRDYPELPEPYNNLAVLHAAANRLDQAREALEMAVRLNPAYAIAHQNLGDVFARMALRSYGEALKLNPANGTLRPKVQALDAVLTTRPAQ